MDTLKDQQWLESLHESSAAPVAGVGRRPALEAERTRVVSLRLMLGLLLDRPELRADPSARDRRAPRRRRDRLRRHSDAARRTTASSARRAWSSSAARPNEPRRRTPAPPRCSRGVAEPARSSCATSPTASFPTTGARSSASSRSSRRELSPDLILTHQRHDLHQDHRLTCELTWNTFRDHLILEYEVPKYDGDMGRPNLFVPLDETLCRARSTT